MPENFPNCCGFHKQVVEYAERWFSDFPDCCETHIKMKTSGFGFKRSHYANVVEKIVTQVSYTEYIIKTKIGNDDWEDDITDYLEFNLDSFGMPSVGNHIYSQFIDHFIKDSKTVPPEKKGILSKFLYPQVEDAKEREKREKAFPNPNVIFDIYQRWLKAFPFSIEYFKKYEAQFKNQWLLTDGKVKVNRYSGIATAKIITESRLIEFLSGLTKKLLQSINTPQLHEEGKINDIQKQRMELAKEKYKFAQQQLFEDYKRGERRYINAIKTWLKNELEYIKEVESIERFKPSEPEPSKIDVLRDGLYKYGFQNLNKIKALTEGQRTSIIEKISNSTLPYKIAMLDYLGFFDSLLASYFTSKFQLYKNVATLLDSGERAIKGNIIVLNQKSNEDRKKYTAHLHKETVVTDYERLK